MEWPTGSIEQIILQALGELGIANPTPRGRTLLLRNRQLVGRRFLFEGVQAVWLKAERRITIFDDRGEVLWIVSVDERRERRAA